MTKNQRELLKHVHLVCGAPMVDGQIVQALRRCPWWLKLKIAAILTWYAWPTWMLELGLKIGARL